MNLFDTHAHLNFRDYYSDADSIIKKSFDSGMEGIINVGSRYDNSELAVSQAQNYERMYSAVGFHPDHLKEMSLDNLASELEKFRKLAKSPKVVAIGEIGFDNSYYRTGVNKDTPENRVKEKDIVKGFLDISVDLNLPVIFHSREAEVETVSILREYASRMRKAGVVHCFTYGWNVAESILDLGFYIGFTGIITFPNTDEIKDAVSKVPLDRILIETDAPFLTPQKYRGQRNEPLYVLEVARKIAEIKGISVGDVVDQTTKNAKTLFGVT